MWKYLLYKTEQHYADNASLVAEKEADRKVLLDLLQEWCVRWRMFVNVDKTAIIIFVPETT